MKSIDKIVHIPDGQIKLIGSLKIPESATGVVLFAHGSGSSRNSPRNNYVAKVLRIHGLGTLLLDLLTVEEDMKYKMRFNIDLLANRILVTTKWLQQQEETKKPYNRIFWCQYRRCGSIASGGNTRRSGKCYCFQGRPARSGMASSSKCKIPNTLYCWGK
ncbi:hypothetical protein U2P91_17565 [Acetobacterium sp. K1/6]|jgi:hypothetical protein|nr:MULTISPECIES: hypothetical protein [unclassified Acetobacterium]MDZ5726836.1 hypothetical protein [Acetobacterium sp. K1/6]